MTEQFEEMLKWHEFSFDEELTDWIWDGEPVMRLGPVHLTVDGKKYVHFVISNYKKSDEAAREERIEALKEAALYFLGRLNPIDTSPGTFRNFCTKEEWTGEE